MTVLMTKVIRFTAEWCGPCKAYAPVFNNVAATTPGMVFETVDIDAQPEIAKHHGIRSVPTTIVDKNGRAVFFKSGLMGETELREVVARH